MAALELLVDAKPWLPWTYPQELEPPFALHGAWLSKAVLSLCFSQAVLEAQVDTLVLRLSCCQIEIGFRVHVEIAPGSLCSLASIRRSLRMKSLHSAERPDDRLPILRPLVRSGGRLGG
jgi:hypothetical protein